MEEIMEYEGLVEYVVDDIDSRDDADLLWKKLDVAQDEMFLYRCPLDSKIDDMLYDIVDEYATDNDYDVEWFMEEIAPDMEQLLGDILDKHNNVKK